MKRFALIIALFLVLGSGDFAVAQAEVPEPPKETSSGETIDLEDTVASSMPLQIIVLLTVLSFIPALLISMTCFTRLIVVFHFLRQALGTQEAPNNQVLLGLALFITLFVMGPTLNTVYTDALKPMIDGEITQTVALERGMKPLRGLHDSSYQGKRSGALHKALKFRCARNV